MSMGIVTATYREPYNEDVNFDVIDHVLTMDEARSAVRKFIQATKPSPEMMEHLTFSVCTRGPEGFFNIIETVRLDRGR